MDDNATPDNVKPYSNPDWHSTPEPDPEDRLAFFYLELTLDEYLDLYGALGHVPEARKRLRESILAVTPAKVEVPFDPRFTEEPEGPEEAAADRSWTFDADVVTAEYLGREVRGMVKDGILFIKADELERAFGERAKVLLLADGKLPEEAAADIDTPSGLTDEQSENLRKWRQLLPEVYEAASYARANLILNRLERTDAEQPLADIIARAQEKADKAMKQLRDTRPFFEHPDGRTPRRMDDSAVIRRREIRPMMGGNTVVRLTRRGEELYVEVLNMGHTPQQITIYDIDEAHDLAQMIQATVNKAREMDNNET